MSESSTVSGFAYNMLMKDYQVLEKKLALAWEGLKEIRNRETIGHNMLSSTGVVAQQTLAKLGASR